MAIKIPESLISAETHQLEQFSNSEFYNKLLPKVLYSEKSKTFNNKLFSLNGREDGMSFVDVVDYYINNFKTKEQYKKELDSIDWDSISEKRKKEEDEKAFFDEHCTEYLNEDIRKLLLEIKQKDFLDFMKLFIPLKEKLKDMSVEDVNDYKSKLKEYNNSTLFKYLLDKHKVQNQNHFQELKDYFPDRNEYKDLNKYLYIDFKIKETVPESYFFTLMFKYFKDLTPIVNLKNIILEKTAKKVFQKKLREGRKYNRGIENIFKVYNHNYSILKECFKDYQEEFDEAMCVNYLFLPQDDRFVDSNMVGKLVKEQYMPYINNKQKQNKTNTQIVTFPSTLNNFSIKSIGKSILKEKWSATKLCNFLETFDKKYRDSIMNTDTEEQLELYKKLFNMIEEKMKKEKMKPTKGLTTKISKILFDYPELVSHKLVKLIDNKKNQIFIPNNTIGCLFVGANINYQDKTKRMSFLVRRLIFENSIKDQRTKQDFILNSIKEIEISYGGRGCLKKEKNNLKKFFEKFLDKDLVMF